MGSLCWSSPSSLLIMVMMTVMYAPVMTLASLTPIVHMTNHCYKNVYVNDSLILDLTEHLQADRVLVGHLSCAVTLHAPPGARVFLHVLQLAISDHAQMPDRLHIYEVSSTGKITNRLTPSTGLYGVLERPFISYNPAGIIIPDFRTAGPRMRLDYQGKPTIVYRGFRVLVTVFYSPEADGSCRAGSVLCPYARTCVPLSVRCDSFPNCGSDDNTDEKSCQREYVVSNILDEYSTRTAVITAVTGILVFLGVAAIVFVVVLKYTRRKYGRGTDQSVHYTTRGGGSCRYKNEADLTRLYAPPSYEDVMTPQRQLKSTRGGHRHSGPPPSYDAVAALVHQEGGNSSEDEVSLKRSSRGRSVPAPLHQQMISSERQQPQGARAKDWDDDDDDVDDVRMHGTWPSDTDEEEEIKARRRKKGGKCKGKARQGSKMETGAPSSKRGLRESATTKHNSTCPDYASARLASSPASKVGLAGGSARAAPPSPSSSPESSSDCSPVHQACSSATSTDMACDNPSGAGSGGEAVSETESQLAGSKRNSRTESHSPDSSSTCSHSASPHKHLSADSGPPQDKAANDLQPPTNSTPIPPPPSILDKLSSSKASSEDSLNQKLVNGDQSKTYQEDYVDLNPPQNSNRSDCAQHT